LTCRPPNDFRGRLWRPAPRVPVLQEIRRAAHNLVFVSPPSFFAFPKALPLFGFILPVLRRGIFPVHLAGDLLGHVVKELLPADPRKPLSCPWAVRRLPVSHRASLQRRGANYSDRLAGQHLSGGFFRVFSPCPAKSLSYAENQLWKIPPGHCRTGKTGKFLKPACRRGALAREFFVFRGGKQETFTRAGRRWVVGSCCCRAGGPGVRARGGRLRAGARATRRDRGRKSQLVQGMKEVSKGLALVRFCGSRGIPAWPQGGVLQAGNIHGIHFGRGGERSASKRQATADAVAPARGSELAASLWILAKKDASSP
jgi:hypothetical protein